MATPAPAYPLASRQHPALTLAATPLLHHHKLWWHVELWHFRHCLCCKTPQGRGSRRGRFGHTAFHELPLRGALDFLRSGMVRNMRTENSHTRVPSSGASGFKPFQNRHFSQIIQSRFIPCNTPCAHANVARCTPVLNDLCQLVELFCHGAQVLPHFLRGAGAQSV